MTKINKNTKTVKNTKTKEITTISAEIWAASGGTIGIFGKLWKQGRLKIVSED